MKPISRRCSFCGRTDIKYPAIIVEGPSIQKHKARICDSCVAICAMQVVAKREELRRAKI